ncbi:cupin-like domain-containing protein [Burkholderia sola]|uniref:cupin-like domain-containing protein n=1 Tax=Burkholderia TaxID=32008 RepID=UPI001AE6885B|nr:cupin-like domain-containing protein [Burkholderia sp. AcTa6-5]MBP0713551.1 cupin-like domain-containing protein [Burkholderia sp. AcTa6-5]
MESLADIKQVFCRRVEQYFLPGYRGGVVQFFVTDPVDGRFYAEISEGIRFLEGVHPDPDAAVEMSGATLRRLVDQPGEMLGDAIKATGDRDLVSLIAHAAQPGGGSGRARLSRLMDRATRPTSPGTEIRRVAAVHSRQLIQLLHEGLPIILTAMLDASGWRMTFDELKRNFGDLPLVGLDADILGATPGMSTFGALVDDALDGGGCGVYSGGCALPGPMHESFELPLLKPKCFTRPQLWMGRRDFNACTRLHRDFLHALIGQARGSKKFILYGPSDAEFLYPGACFNLFQLARFDPFEPDLARFPLARQASPIECELHPGELLVLPAGWFHTVISNGAVMSVNRFLREDAWAVLMTRGGFEA